ncbi:hypothetical protein HanXRQr2_Chr04g0144091 [Helianthus annuus]|uniref:Uncharacterized protein n=1 Tax=Helianthus annuus TaxID=4232 RepID=A0A9K3NPJ3_HELAN|nr:hypothetical protein HanXRQr2_Chr04g0144091 [Helianthus annuus]
MASVTVAVTFAVAVGTMGRTEEVSDAGIWGLVREIDLQVLHTVVELGS